ncbi:Transposable element P transposase [Amphibalanus amphitrite]|uniref:Transposable element P transposase n=1 Tax=Amphibalanus amphitrite TaxID=1232801 RepID=A0A6A4VUK9_AMPAM|nr:Transposable element P transposase [Amphibalanus amphitrite]
MEKIQMRPGFHDAILALIKEKFAGSSDQDKLCVIAFDEIHLKARLAYQRSDDIIEGFADHGPLGRSNACADHALVMMVRGITKRWKQPLGFFLSAGTTKGHRAAAAAGTVHPSCD